ncbi:MAG: hypothetical protein MUE56_03535 [Ignavibacteria bacterium]|jgi:CheY-like chemotaxis protein|nr:hypothetical protein [Ignavibacteria bacterium]
MTRKILLVSDDEDFKNHLKTVTLTITKLNHQITITEDINDGSIDWVIIDFDNNAESNHRFVRKSRAGGRMHNIKFVAVLTEVNDNNRSEIFASGCDSVMNKDEFKRVANSILLI